MSPQWRRPTFKKTLPDLPPFTQDAIVAKKVDMYRYVMWSWWSLPSWNLDLKMFSLEEKWPPTRLQRPMGNFCHLYQRASIHWLMRMWQTGWYITIICSLQIGKWMWAMGIILPALKFVLMMLPPLNKTQKKIAPLGRRQKGHQLRHASLAAGTPSPEIFTLNPWGETWILRKKIHASKKVNQKIRPKWWWFNGDKNPIVEILKKITNKNMITKERTMPTVGTSLGFQFWGVFGMFRARFPADQEI